MKMCPTCWSSLKKAIEERGLGQFVAKSSEALAEKLTTVEFEPLMGAHNALVANALDAGGLELLAHEGCPLCFLIDRCACGMGERCSFRTWIDRAADDALTEAKRLGLVPEN